MKRLAVAGQLGLPCTPEGEKAICSLSQCAASIGSVSVGGGGCAEQRERERERKGRSDKAHEESREQHAEAAVCAGQAERVRVAGGCEELGWGAAEKDQGGPRWDRDGIQVGIQVKGADCTRTGFLCTRPGEAGRLASTRAEHRSVRAPPTGAATRGGRRASHGTRRRSAFGPKRNRIDL